MELPFGESFEDVLFDPLAKQRTLAQFVRSSKAEPLTAIPTQGPKMPPPRAAAPQSLDDPTNPNATPPWLAAGYQPHQQAQALPQSTQAASPAPARPDPRQQSLDYAKQALEAATTMPDMSEQVQRYRQGYEAAGPDMAFAAFMSEMGGETGQQMGGQILKHALAARAPRTTDYGTIDYEGGFTADPMKERAFRVSRLEKQAQLLEAAAQHAETVEQRREAARQANELRREIAEQSNATRMAIAESRRATGDKLHLQRAGTTPAGELVTFNPATGQQLVNGEPYNGPVLSQATLDKQATTVQESMASARRYGELIEQVEANPNAFSGASPLMSLAPDVIASRARAGSLTPEQYQVYSSVQQQASSLLNQIFGAALSAGEATRAMPWIPAPTDNLATTLNKLKAARAWQESESNKYGASVRGAAESRSGVAPSDAPPPGAVREKR